MQLLWGVYPLLGPASKNTDDLIELSMASAKDNDMIHEGDLVVITAGVLAGKPGSTNLIKVMNVGTRLVSGVGIGKRSVVGKVCIAANMKDFAEKLLPGDILVVGGLVDEAVPYAIKASAIIAEEGGLTSSVAILGVSYGIPVIVGAAGATEKLKDGMEATVDATSGIVYQGKVNIK